MLYMFLADGCEETEAIGCLDVIKRAELDITTVSIDKEFVCGAHGVVLKADILKKDVDFEDMTGIILPGGMPGTTNLQKDELVQKAIGFCQEKGLLMAAICAAPMILGERGVLDGRRAVCYPGFEEHLIGAKVEADLCVAHQNTITAKGAGASMLFGASIVDYFKAGEGRKILDLMQHS
ncbi:MAG: DJ-1/PfpI family protein [Clostridia bacterium]|nr:DJ-1/PfpI family protein [Clostridia bacterium]